MKKLLCKQSLLGILAVAACAAAPAGLMLDDLTWSGNGGPTNRSWSWPCNWAHRICLPNGPIPDEADDKATFPWNGSGAWTVDLFEVEVSINSLTIDGSVDFLVVPDVPNPFRITTDTLWITPTTGDIEITMTGDAEIKVP